MKIDYEKYYEIYHVATGKFFDAFQTEDGLRTLPFASNGRSIFDKKCGLQGMTGEFFRKWKDTETHPICNFEEDVEKPVSIYLKEMKQMQSKEISLFVRILRDILYVNGNLNITESSFLKYLPITPDDETISEKDKQKYKRGQEAVANYIFSLVTDENKKINAEGSNNLVTTILKEALEQGSSLRNYNDLQASGTYYIYDYIKKSFYEDMNWLLEQEESVIVKNMPLLLYFYACYSVTQTVLGLSPNKIVKTEKPEKMYFILSTEKASMNSEAVLHGWKNKIPKTVTIRLYGKIQAINIANCILGGNIGLYPEILEKLNETPFDENKEACERILANYQEDKIINLRRRKVESFENRKYINNEVNSYKEFLDKLHSVCIAMQSDRYGTLIDKQLISLMAVRFLQLRRGNYILTLDNEMLIFLIAMVTKGKKTKLENMYKAFNNYGIFFNIATRTAIEELLLKLNLLDRKSDSGEAQYVTVIL